MCWTSSILYAILLLQSSNGVEIVFSQIQSWFVAAQVKFKGYLWAAYFAPLVHRNFGISLLLGILLTHYHDESDNDDDRAMEIKMMIMMTGIDRNWKLLHQKEKNILTDVFQIN